MRSNLLKHNNLMLRSERRERLEAWAAGDSPMSHSRVLPGGDPEQFVEHLGLPGRRQWFVRQRKAEKRPVDNLGTGTRYVIGQSGRFEEALHITQPAAVDGLHCAASHRIERGPGPNRLLQHQPAAECLAQQRFQRIVVGLVGLEIGNDLLGGNLAPVLEDGGMERADIGKVPVEAAARYAHCFRQRFGLQRRETVAGQRLEALTEPVFCGELIGHPSSCDNSPYTTVLTVASTSAIGTIQPCMESGPMRDLLLQCSGIAAIAVALIHGVLLIAAPWMASEPARHWIVITLAAVFAFAALANAWALRGRHFGWVALSAVVALAVAGY